MSSRSGQTSHRAPRRSTAWRWRSAAAGRSRGCLPPPTPKESVPGSRFQHIPSDGERGAELLLHGRPVEADEVLYHLSVHDLDPVDTGVLECAVGARARRDPADEEVLAV